jgi:hypothetical protein
MENHLDLCKDVYPLIKGARVTLPCFFILFECRKLPLSVRHTCGQGGALEVIFVGRVWDEGLLDEVLFQGEQVVRFDF